MTTLIILVLVADIIYITIKKDQQIKQAYNQGFMNAVNQINQRNAA